jgi:hypothetical protein
MSRVIVVLLVSAAGCRGARDPADVLACGRTESAALAPCPSERALVTHLRERWALLAAATVTTTCTPGRFGSAGWLIDATVEQGDDVRTATFVLQPSCGALTDAALRDEPPDDARHEAIDLDGDGIDEILTRRSAVEDGGTSGNLEVARVGGGRLARAGKIRVAFDGTDPAHPEAGALVCDGTVHYLARPDRGFYVEIEAVRSADSELCLATGRHRFELGSGGLRRP